MTDAYEVGELTVSAPRSNLRRPRVRAIIGGDSLLPISGQITRNNNFQADTFSLDFSLTADPDKDVDWWGDRNDMKIEIQLGFADEDGEVAWTSTMSGIVDDAAFDLIKRTVNIRGRDKLSLFEEKTKETYANKTSSEVVKELAAKHGMKAEVDPTTRLVGTYYKGNSTHSAPGEGRSQKQIDLLIFLARKEGFSLWSEGDTLFFKDIQSEPETQWVNYAEPEIQNGVSRAIPGESLDLRVTRSFNASKEIKVIVESYHPRQGKTHKATAQTKLVKSTAGKGSETTGATVYYFRPVGLTLAEAQEYANRRHAELTDKQWVLEWEAVADLSLTPRTLLKLDGSDLGVLDQDYYAEEVSFRFGFGIGLTMSVRAKNRPDPAEEGSECGLRPRK